ncbi:MAG: tRNA (N6-isopentenyl adenosine(37)-C2)-methylthiotransferase MiaB [Rhodospirillales bacterium]|nr:MAG: tRNA (N6-isopentenyl adenosine(37)-C2)-methylthiotransferase MiaB [Rhodospirillales bacterium]
MTKRVFIKTYGCQMNVYDSARMADVLAPVGFAPVDTADQADLIILNTCHIREKAAEKVYSELGRLKHLKHRPTAEGGPVLLAVAGCVAQAEGAEILARAPYVDMVFGPQTLHRLPEMIARVARNAGQVLETDFPVDVKFDHLPEVAASSSGVTAFLTIQEGCDKFCTFCVVPYTRGAEYSRPVAEVLAEASRLAASGVREITLLGQNVNAYHGAADGGEWRLARLIAAVADIPGIARIRYTTSHPVDMTDDLIAAHREIDTLMPYLHLPVQSGSDRVLRAMGRHHSADAYRQLVDRLREARPDLALSSDLIVGFPDETDADFRATMDLVTDVQFAQAYSFMYSPRPGTPAAAAPQLDEPVKRERLAELQALLDAQQRAFNQACVGRDLPVLFERPGRHPGQLAGRTPYMQAVHAHASPDVLNTIQAVHIDAATPNSLAGILAERVIA